MASNLPAADDMEHIHNQALNRNRFRHNTSCTVRHTNNRIAIVHQNPYIVHSIEQREIVDLKTLYDDIKLTNFNVSVCQIAYSA